jgi:hypothetical protein
MCSNTFCVQYMLFIGLSNFVRNRSPLQKKEWRRNSKNEVTRNQGCTNLGHKVAVATELCALSLNVCEPSVWNLLYATLLALKILRWLLGFGKFVYPCLKHIWIWRLLSSCPWRRVVWQNLNLRFGGISSLHLHSSFTLGISSASGENLHQTTRWHTLDVYCSFQLP